MSIQFECDELYHHGILGMKWGVRRYRNYDGSLTSAGRRRYDVGPEEQNTATSGKRQGMSSAQKKTVAKAGAALVGTAATLTAAYYFKTHPEARRKAADAVKAYGKEKAKRVGKAIDKGTDAAVTAAVTTVATYYVAKAIAKVDKMTENSDPLVRDVARNAAKAGLDTAQRELTSKSGTAAPNGPKAGAQVGKEATELVGPPSQHGPIAKNTPAYQNLFKDSSGSNRSDSQRATIKALANQGYSPEQIQRMLEAGLIHSGIMFDCDYRNELYHHGILGMKWGVRRFQNADGSLKPAGRRRYGDSEHMGRVINAKAAYKRAKKDYNEVESGRYHAKKYKENREKGDGIIKSYSKASKANVARSLKTTSNLTAKQEEYKLEKEMARMKAKGKDGTEKKSGYRQNLEAKYIQKGYTPEQAAAASNRQIRTQKALIGVGATLLAAGATAALIKRHEQTVDKVLKEGHEFARIDMNKIDANNGWYDKVGNKYGEIGGTVGSNKMAYIAEVKNGDADTYKNFFADERYRVHGDDTVYQNKFKAARDLKVASEKSSKQAFKELLEKDPEFREAMINKTQLGSLDDAIHPGSGKVKSKKALNDLYNKFNKDLVVDKADSYKGRKLVTKFNDYMQSKGYDAYQDMNDKHLSGLASKSPYIFIGDNKDKFKDYTSEYISIADAQALRNDSKNVNKQMLKYTMTRTDWGKYLGTRGAAVAGVGAATALGGAKTKGAYGTNKFNQTAIKNYRKEHPNSELTDREINDMLKKKK